MSGDCKTKVGSRKSELALIQTNHVISLLKEKNPHKEFEIVTMNTLGDKVLDVPLPKIGEKSLFTKELEVALASGAVDFVVHSLKDLPTVLPPGMAIGAILSRDDPRDALVMHRDFKTHTLATLPNGSTIGTSSLRRAAQLAKSYPHLRVENIRGNLNTRLRKLDEMGVYSGIILATAGLHRMGWHDRITRVLEKDDIMYAVGQGALAVECRLDDVATIELLRPLYDVRTSLRVLTERSFLKTLGGGCSAPVAVTSEITHVEGTKHRIELFGAVWSLDGSIEIKGSDVCELDLGKDGKCAVCPYKNSSLKETETNISSCTRTFCTKKDIECLNECSFKGTCTKKPTARKGQSPVHKKQKTTATDPSVNATADDTSTSDLLKDDPHLDLPIGYDFMGKCPYLESKLNPKTSKTTTKDDKPDIKKCPFYRNAPSIVCSSAESTKTAATLNGDEDCYCGLVPHIEIGKYAMDAAADLGVRLAKKLVERGAEEVITNAQNTIRSS